MNDALTRLFRQAKEDYEQPWHPGKELTDVEQIVKFIKELQKENEKLSKIALDYSWITNPDRMGR